VSRLAGSPGSRALLAAVGGAALAASFPRPGWWGLLPFALALLFALGVTATPRRAAAEGLVAGFLFHALLLRWFANVITDHTTLGPVVALAAVLASGLLLATLVALVLWTVARLSRSYGPGFGLATAPALWVGLEHAREWIPLPFPWGALAAAPAATRWATEAAAVVGSGGLSLSLAIVSAALAALALGVGRGLRILAIALAALAAIVLAGSVVASRSDGPPVRVAVVQASLPRTSPPEAELDAYLALTAEALEAGARIVVWPESATPFRVDKDYVELLRREIAAGGADLVLGSVTGDPESGIYNSAALVRADGGLVSVSPKRILVPFGEYVPLRSLLSNVPMLVEAPGEFSRGREAVVHEGTSARIGVLVCYESVFPALAAELEAGGAELLVNITNDSWFGRTSGPEQHLLHGLLRSAETGRPLLRAANSGISVIVDGRGRIVERLGVGERGVLVADIRLASRAPWGARAGRVASAACAILAAVLLAAAVLRRGDPDPAAPDRDRPSTPGSRGATDAPRRD
jgi:apolipoprotein N-acyltransferase